MTTQNATVCKQMCLFMFCYLYSNWCTDSPVSVAIGLEISTAYFMHIKVSWCSFLLAGIYNKYDTVIYPPHPARSFLEMVQFWKSSPVEFKPMDSVQMRQECLHRYLTPFGLQICSEELLPNYNIVSLSKQTLDIYFQLCRMHIIHKDGRHQEVPKAGVHKVNYQIYSSYI